LLSGHNFDGKRTFIEDHDGLSLLLKLISDSELKKSIRLQRKVYLLVNDLVLNDDCIKAKEDIYHVRNAIASSEEFMKNLLLDLNEAA